MKLIATRKAHQNQTWLDPWTAVHVASGLALGLIDVPLRHALGAAIAYEVMEQVFERHPRGKTFFRTSGPEVIPNAILDTLALVIGHALGQAWNATAVPD